jgi:hypothetical protein
MSSIALTGNAAGAGVFTLASPNSASSYTLTLPTTTGTLIAGVATEAQGGTGTTVGYNGFKNRIINGAMVIDQRNAGASVTPAAAGYLVDRWAWSGSASSKLTFQQNYGSVTPPIGFSNYLGVFTAVAFSTSSTNYFNLYQKIEGFNVADLGWGTANAKTVTLSFQIYSNQTGTFGGSLLNSATDRSYPFSYTVSSANTWTQVSITIAGDTSGTWIGSTNGTGIYLSLDLGSGATYRGTAGAWTGSAIYGVTGSVNLVGIASATFYITGVQLEKGSTATSFDYRPYGTELALCQRYYEKSYNQDVVPGVASFTPGFASSTASSNAPTQANGCTFKVTKRANPTCVSYNAVTGASGSAYRVSDGTNVAVTLTSIGYSGVGYLDFASNPNGYYWHFTASAEL